MADCEFCGSGVDVEAQDMGENRVMMLCASCRANIKHGKGETNDGDEYPCPHCGAMNPDRTGYLRITCRVCSGQYEARHLVSSTSIAELAQQVSEERHAREQVNPAMGLEFVNTARWEPLGHAYAMSLRLTELHLAICTVEECGASPELTEAVTRLNVRLQYLQSQVRKSINASIGNGWTSEVE